MKMERGPDGKVFYGWWIVAACFLTMFCTFGIVYNCNGLFIVPVTTEMGFTRQQMAMNSTIISSMMMVISLFAGKIFSRFNVKHVMRVGALVMVIGYAGYSMAQSLSMFYMSSVLVGLGMACTAVLPISIVINSWFNLKRGTAMGIASTGSGIGGMILNQVAGKLIPAVGWRQSYLMLACLMGLVILPCVFFIIKKDPAEIGLEPFGGVGRVVTNVQDDGLTLAEATKTKKFWVFICILVVNAVATGGIVQNLAPYINELGYPYSFGATMASLNMASLAAGKFLLGNLYDRKGARFTTVCACACSAIAMGSMVLASVFMPSFGLMLLCSGIGCAFGSTGIPILVRMVFGNKDYSSLYGVSSFASNLGGALSPILIGRLFDATGTYKTGFSLFCVLSVFAATVFFLLLGEKKTKKTQAA